MKAQCLANKDCFIYFREKTFPNWLTDTLIHVIKGIKYKLYNYLKRYEQTRDRQAVILYCDSRLPFNWSRKRKKNQVCSITKSHTLINQALFFFCWYSSATFLCYQYNYPIIVRYSIPFPFSLDNSPINNFSSTEH